jgi:hypothetical protein
MVVKTFNIDYFYNLSFRLHTLTGPPFPDEPIGEISDGSPQDLYRIALLTPCAYNDA